MATGSLVVKISADLNDFSTKLKAMTKDVTRASDTLVSLGKKMSLGITLPVLAAGVALAKMGMENEQVGRKMGRVFGSDLARVQGNLNQLAKIIPETGTELQKMAISTMQFGQGLGMAAPQATKLSEGMMSMAAGLSADKLIDYGQALDLVSKALEGQTRGLKEIGVVISEAQIKQEAYRLGLMKTGQELTPLGTALATYSLLSAKTSSMTGEAGNIAQDAATQWRFFKVQLSEFADNTSNLVVPGLKSLISAGRSFVDLLNTMPDGVKQLVGAIAGIVAVAGPAIIVIATLVKSWSELKAAATLIKAGGGIAGMLGAAIAPEFIAGIVAVGVALAGVYEIWKYFHPDAAAEEKSKLQKPPDVAALMKKGAATAISTGSPLELFQKQAGQITQAFEQVLTVGRSMGAVITDGMGKVTTSSDPLVTAYDKIVRLHERARELLAAQKGEINEIALAAGKVAIETERLLAIRDVVKAADTKYYGREVVAASRTFASDDELRAQAAQSAVDAETQLRLREITLTLPDAFNAVREAAVQMGQQLRDVSHAFRTQLATFKASWSSVGAIGSSAMAGLKQGATQVLASFTPMGLAVQAIGAIMQGLQPVLDALFVPLTELGKIVGIMLTPILKLLFLPLKALGIIVSFLGEILARVSAGIATAVGKLFVGLGTLLNKIPFVHLGDPVKKAGEAILAFADSQYEAADQLKRARKELEGMQFGDTANSVDALGNAARDAAEQLTNFPNAFKVQLARYLAQLPIGGDPNVPTAGSGGARPVGPIGAGPWGPVGGGVLSDRTPIVLTLDSRVLAQSTLGVLRAAAAGQLGNASRFAELSVLR